MLRRLIVISLVLSFLQACTTKDHYLINSYKYVSNEIQKNYRISRADLIIIYDLARIDHTNCIYSDDLGLFANEKNYAKEYLNKFRAKYISEAHLKKELRKKISAICRLLINIHNKYKILSHKQYNYVKKLSKTNLTKIDLRKELSHLDLIISHVPLMLPSYKAYISSHYGKRKHPFTKKRTTHCGIDLVNKLKSPIYSSANGQVVFVGKQNGYGLVVEIEHENNIKTKYAHLDKIFVKQGQKIMRSQAIALQGKSGNARTEHLHFEIHVKGKHIDPYEFIGHNFEYKRK